MSVSSFVESILRDAGNSVFTYTVHRLKGGYFCGVGGDKGANPFDSVAENRIHLLCILLPSMQQRGWCRSDTDRRVRLPAEHYIVDEKELVGGPDGKGMDCKSIALKSNVFDSHTDLQDAPLYHRGLRNRIV